MNNLSPYKIIDYVLDCFNKSSIENTVRIEHYTILHKLRSNGLEISVEFMEEAINKLVKEGFLERTKITPILPKGGYPFYQYYLTLEGLILINDGGYFEMIKLRKKDANRKDFYEFIVAVGTGIAGLYVIFQIIESITHSIVNTLIIVHHP